MFVMKATLTVVSLTFFLQSAFAHYIFNTLIFHNSTSLKAVRRPRTNSPVSSVTSLNITCNVDTISANETVILHPGNTIGFKIDKPLFHPGPASMYLGKAPAGLALHKWNGSGAHWFKIYEWGAAFKPFRFKSLNKSELTTTIPKDTPPGEYLVRIEHLAMHILPPEVFVSCAQINITGNGTGTPTTVAIPGPRYISANDSKIHVDIYWPIPTSFVVPGPPVWRGSESA